MFINTDGKLRYSVFKHIYVEIGIKDVNCKKKPVQLKAGFYVTEHGQ